MATKQSKARAATQTAMRGLIPLPDRSGYSLDLGQVKPSHQSFTARGFSTIIEDGEFVATFGWKPRALEPEHEDRFNLAVSFSLIVETSLKKFVDSCWTDKSVNKDYPFAKSLEDALTPEERGWAENYSCETKLPLNIDRAMREFPATAVSSTLWNGRGYLEFVEISSAVIRTSHDGRARDTDPVRSLAIVVMIPKLMYAFLIAAKKQFEEVRN